MTILYHAHTCKSNTPNGTAMDCDCLTSLWVPRLDYDIALRDLAAAKAALAEAVANDEASLRSSEYWQKQATASMTTLQAEIKRRKR